MFESAVTIVESFREFVSLGEVSSVIAIVTCLVGLLTYMRVKNLKTRLLKDIARINDLINLPEILFHIKQVRKSNIYIDQPIHKNFLSMETRIEAFLEFTAGIQLLGCHPLVCAAKYCRSNGEIWKAAILYRKAIQYECEYGGNTMNMEELNECYQGLQKCHFALWDVEEARNVAISAEKAGVVICKPEGRLRRWAFLMCIEESTRCYFRGITSVVNGRRKRSPRISKTSGPIVIM